jgi:hypothetical protein
VVLELKIAPGGRGGRLPHRVQRAEDADDLETKLLARIRGSSTSAPRTWTRWW